MDQKTVKLPRQQQLFQSNHLLHLDSKRPVFPADILHETKKIATGFAYVPYYERSASETNCFVRISHFLLTDAQIAITRVPEKNPAKLVQAPLQRPESLLYSVDKIAIDFLSYLDLTSGFFSKDDAGNIKEMEMRKECLFYNRDHMVDDLEVRKIFTLVYGRIKEGGHSIALLMDVPHPVSQEYDSFVGNLGIEFTFNPPLGSNIFDQKKDNDYDLRVSQADVLLKGKPIDADEILFSKIQDANRFFVDLREKIKTYFEKSGSAVAASTQPSVTYERVVTLSHDLEG